MECLLIADDLTGACDAAAPFASRGLRAAVTLAEDGEALTADVLAVSTESRGLSAEDSRRATLRVARRLKGSEARILFKKIDSTLRGNAGAEIAAAMEAFGCRVALITPAFPAMRRIVRDGWLRVEGGAAFEPVELDAYFRAQGLIGHRHVCAGEELTDESVSPTVSVDAACDADLDALVHSVMQSRGRILWAGSAGLASALARSMGNGGSARPEKPCGPVLFCVGSTHAATVAQQRRLMGERAVCAFSAETAAPGELTEVLRNGRGVLLGLPYGRVAEERVSELLGGVRQMAGALALTGGDTASHVCRALHARGIELHDEVQVGIPWGTLRGGMLDGMAVATKSGGFGDSGALMEIMDFFTCPKT